SMVLSVRPLQGIKCVPESPNTSAATLTVYTYDGSSFTECSNVVDGTSTFGRTLNRTGTVTFDSTLGTSKPYHFEGMYLYAYLIELSGGSATISHVSLDAPWQPILDVWDGVARQPILFQMSYSSAYEDYTLAVNESSVVDYPVGGILDQLDTTDHVLIMFEEKTAAIRFQVLGSMVNTNATNAVIKYWDGDSYETVGTVTDTTKTGTKSLGQTGLMSWNPPSGEEPRTLFGVTGYIYQLTFSAQLSGTHGDATEEILVDIVTGVPAQATVYPFDFPSIYKNRLLLCSFSEGKEG
ncbi:MAG: hypothetical protein GY841_14825, partial [FCB group bacterium]|nr:hypothetical protein [FCB group bacterium]